MMRRLLLLLFGCHFSIFIATNIDAVSIDYDYTFSVANSPYYIQAQYPPTIFTQNVIIENGAEIIFTRSSTITIAGNLTAGCNEIDTTTDKQRGLSNPTTFVHIHGNETLSTNTGGIFINSSNPADTQIKFCNVKFSRLSNVFIIQTPTPNQPDQLVSILVDNCEFYDNTNIQLIWYTSWTSTTTTYTESIISNTTGYINYWGDAIYD
eukprot:257900_1